MKNYCNNIKLFVFFYVVFTFITFVKGDDFLKNFQEEKNKGNYQSALKILATAEKNADLETKKKIIQEKINIFLLTKDFEKLGESYLELARLEEQPNLKLNLYQQAAVNFENGKLYEKSAQTYLKIYNLFGYNLPTNELLAHIGELYLKANNLEKAENIFILSWHKAINEYEKNYTFNNLIQFYFKYNLYNKAEKIIKNQLKQNPEKIYFENLLCEVLFLQNKITLALTTCEKLLKKNPLDENILTKVILLWKKQNIFNSKIKDLENNYQKTNNKNFAYLLAKIYFSEKNETLAIFWYENILKNYPQDKTALFELGSIYQKIGNLKDAKIILEKLVNLYPNESTYVILLGDTYLLLKEKEKALNYYKNALNYNPFSENSLRQFANFLFDKQLYLEAINIYLEGRKNLKNEFLFSQELTNLYLITQNSKNALNEYLKLLTSTNNTNPQIEAELKQVILDNESLTDYFFSILSKFYLSTSKTIQLFALPQFVFSVFNSLPFTEKEKYLIILQKYFSAEFFLQKSEFYFKNSQFAECILVSPAMEKLNLPQKEIALINLANCYYGLGKNENALLTLAKLNKIGATNISILWEANELLLSILLEEGKTKKALQTIQALLQQNIFSVYENIIKVYLVKAYLFQQKYKLALETINALPLNINTLNSKLKDLEILYLKAEVYLRNHKYKTALKLYYQLIDINPASFFANNSLEKIYLIKNVKNKKILINYLKIVDLFSQKKYLSALKLSNNIQSQSKVLFLPTAIIQSKTYHVLNLFTESEKILLQIVNHKDNFYSPYAFYLLVLLYTDEKNYNPKIAFNYLLQLKKAYPQSLFVKEVFNLEEDLRKKILEETKL